MDVGIALLLVVLAISLIASVFYLARWRRNEQKYSPTLAQSVVPVNLMDNENAVIVSEGRGHLVFANQMARHWFDMNGGEPDLELMAGAVQPTEAFLELFGKEGQSTFRIGTRRIEASSHYIPHPVTPQIVVVMKQLQSATYDKRQLDPVQAMNVVSEITQTISGSLKLDQTLDSILKSIGSVVAFDSSEITLWDEDLSILRPLGQGGEISYVENLNSTDGVYHMNDSFSGWIARYRQPLLISDVSQRTDVKPKIANYPFVSFIGMPLTVGDRFIGTLEMASRTRAAFDHEDMILLQAVAGQAAIAIENARLYQSQSERVTELSGLQQIASAMTSLTEPRQMFAQLSSRIAALMNVEMCGVLLFDPSQNMLVSQAPFYGVPDAIVSLYRIPLADNSAANNLFNNKEWWYTNNVKGDDLVRQIGLLNLAEAVGVRTTALVPMVVGNRRFGVVQASNKRDGSGFSENDVRLLAIFAAQAAIVVENARLYDEEQRRADELGGLQQISQAIGVLRNAEELYGQINERIGKLMNVQMCGILLEDNELKQLVSQSPFYGVSDEVVRYYQISVAPGSAMYALYNESEYWISNDLRTDSVVREIGLDKLALLLGARNALLVPLIVGGNHLGVVQVSNKLNGTDFSSDDARILSIFASQAAVIIDNARLYRQMRQRADESEGLRKIAEIASGNLALDQVIKAVVDETKNLLGAHIAAVGLLDDLTGELTIRPEWSSGMEGLTEAFSMDAYSQEFQTSVVISKRTFMSNDLHKDGGMLPIYLVVADRFKIDAIIQVPLVVRDRGIGELIVGASGDNKDFSPDDVRLAQAVAFQIASVVERSRLYAATDADLRARIQELDSLTRVSNELNLTIELDRILEVIRHEAQRTTQAEMATVVVFKPEESWLAPNEPAIEQRLGTDKALEALAPIEKEALARGEMVAISSYESSNLEPQPPKARSAVAAPIQYGGQTAGVVHVFSEHADAFGKQAQEFIKALTNQAAIAVGNSVRYRQQLDRSDLLKVRADQLSQIFELGRTLRSQDNIDQVLEAVANGVTEALGFNAVVVSMTDEKNKRMQRTAQSGFSLEKFKKMQKDSPTLAQVEAMFQPRYQISSSYFLPAEDRANWETSDLPLVTTDNAGAASAGWKPDDLLLIPLRSPSGQLMGLMSVDEPRDGKRPNQMTVEALEIFANQAAFAIENYLLVQAFQNEAEATRRERDRLAQLHLVASEIQRAADIPARLQIVADGILSAGWGRVAITLRGADFEPRETITAGYNAKQAALYRENLLPGIVWNQRLTDPDFRQYRIGQAYYLRNKDQWVTENKLIAGMTEAQSQRSTTGTGPLTDPNATWHPQDTVYLPLYGLDRSRLIGIISMDTPADGKPPTEASMRPIELFAAQAASAIENTRLYEETQRAAQQEARINEVMEAVASTLEMGEIIRSVARGLQQMIPFTRMSVALLDRAELGFDVQRVVTDRRGEVTIEPGEPILVEGSASGQVYREGVPRVYHLADAERTPNQSDLKAWRDSGERTALIVPLFAGGRVLGTLHMGSELAEAFGFEEQLPLVARMANLTAIAIENARLLEQAIERERFSTALGRVGQSVNAMLDMASILDTVCEESTLILEVEGAYIWLVEGEEMVGLAARGPGAKTFIGTRRPLTDDNTIGASVIRERSGLFDNHVGTPEARYRSVLGDIPIQAMLGVPLMREGRAIGVLVAAQSEHYRAFNTDDIERAQAFGVQAAIAIENARLFQQTLGLQSFNEAIVQSIQQGIVVLDRNTTIRTVNAYMHSTYDWEDSAVGKALFDYRPNYVEFLQFAISKVLQSGEPEVQYDIKETNIEGKPVIRNFYIYPLLEGDAVSGIVLLVEDVTERAALEADIETRAEQLSMLSEVSGRLTSTLNPDFVVSILLDQLERILSFDNVTLWLRRENKLVIGAARGYVDAQNLIGIEAEIADSELFREIASHGQVLNIPDITKDPRFPLSQDRPVRSWLGVSLVSQGNLAGLLVLEKSQIGFYTPTMEQLALTYANQAAIALENARLFQEANKSAEENTRLYRETSERATRLDQQAQRLTLLNRVSEALAQSLDIENVLEVSLREMVQVLDMDRGAAILFEPDQQRGRLIIEYPRSETPPSDIMLDLNNPVTAKLRSSLQPVVINDAQTDKQVDYIRETVTTSGVISMMIVPLAVGGQVIGSIGLDSISGRREFSPEQIELAQTIASQAAIAIQNANLFEQSVIRTRELETLFEATQSITVTLELGTVLHNAAQQMLFALQVDNCVISYWDNVENRLVVATNLDRTETETHPTEGADSWVNLAEYPVRQQVLESAQAIIVRDNDRKADAAERRTLKAHKAHTRIILPMVVRDHAIGLIELESRTPGRTLIANELRLARTLASQAAVAIDNARLQSETASKLEELFVINELSTALSSSIEQSEIFKVVEERLPSLIKAQSLLLALLSEDHDTISYPVVVRSGKKRKIASHALGDDEVSYVIKKRAGQYLGGENLADVLKNLQINMKITKAKAFLGVPMIASDEVVGALVLSDDKNARTFTLDDQRVLSTVGAQIAVAIQNARLFARTRQFTAELEQAVKQRTEELQQERDRIEFLYRITTGLTSSLDMDLVLTRALEMMVQSVDADMGAILGIDSISDNLTYRATVGLPAKERDNPLTFSQREGLAGWVIQSQQSIVVADVQTDPRWLRMNKGDEEPHGAIAALLEANEDVLGVVTLYSRRPNAFNDDQLRLVTAAANQIASAMNNAELYSLIREQAERLGAMVRREQVDATKNAAIVESIADGVMVADQGGDIVQFNSAAERILALPRRQVIGQHISALAGLYASSGGTQWLDALQHWLDDPTSYHPGEDVEVRLNLDNDRFVSVILSPVNMGDQFLGTVSVFRDITREIEVDRMKSEFVATVSHELRTPMTSIKGYADLLLLGAAGAITDQQERFLSTIKTNADRLSILVNELLDISRVDRGIVRLNLIPTDVQEVVDTTVGHLRERIASENKKLEVVVNVPQDMPQLRADFDKFSQIMNNVLDNAFNYTRAGGTVTVSARQEQDGKTVLFSIKDTGIGIAKDKQDRVWQRFFRDDEEDLVKSTSGTGLGLAIAKEYITMHNGEIWLESTPGEGSTFYLRIPIYAPEAEAA